MKIANFNSGKHLTPLERATTDSGGNRTTPRVLTPLDLKLIDGIEDIARAEVSIDISYPTTYRQAGGGSGFIISEDGLVITNKHVLGPKFKNQDKLLEWLNTFKPQIEIQQLKQDSKQEAGAILLANSDGSVTSSNDQDSNNFETCLADIIAVSDTHDLALLRMRKEPGVRLKISENTAQEEEESYTLSHPHGIQSPVISYGQVLSLEQAKKALEEQIGIDDNSLPMLDKVLQDFDDNQMIISDNSVDSGSSGSPLMNKSAEVLGVVTAKNRNLQLPQVTKFQAERYVRANGEMTASEPSDKIFEFLEKNGLASEKISDAKVRARDLKVLYKSIESPKQEQSLNTILLRSIFRDFFS